VPSRQKRDQAAPGPVGPTGARGRGATPPATVPEPDNSRRQQGEYLTTAQGLRLPTTDNSLRAGNRGPALLEDFHLREKIMHFDHERIPERVVHARGAAAHGAFRAYGNADDVTSAGLLTDSSRETPVFVRFSTVVGSRGSADTVRDIRGFATKFYTPEGTFDLVGNNIPVFFIQDGIKFPDLIHAAKPHPDREIPQAQTAHDTFWDFVSLQPETTHTVIWVMSDRGIPRSFRTMEGFGVHTFRLVNAAGQTTLAKFHWKPVAGVHSLVWEEAQIAAGTDPDFHRRDLADSIEAGAFPEWELGLQLMPDTDDQTFEGIDLLDATKIVPEELVPVRAIGRMTLMRNPTNYFAETEQVAFHTGHLVPGIEVTDDPLMQARLFSYLDTQLTRLGGPNFSQLPINRPHADVNDNLRDGMHQTAVPDGIAPYLPNSLDAGSPATAGAAGYVNVPREVSGPKVRERAASFDDHYSQATLFWNSMAAVEKAHVVEAFTFELGKCYEQPIRERMLANLANVDADLCAAVAAGLGLPAPVGSPATDVGVSPSLSQVYAQPGPITGRVIGVLAVDGADLAGIAKLREGLMAQGAVVRLIAEHGGTVTGGRGRGRSSATVERTYVTTRSIEYDAVVVAAGAGALAMEPKALILLQEAFRHGKAVAAWGDGVGVLQAARIPAAAPGVLTAENVSATLRKEITRAVGLHRSWDRVPLVAQGVAP